MADGQTIALEEFETYNGKCAFCRHRSGYASWCYKKSRTVLLSESCKEYEFRVRA